MPKISVIVPAFNEEKLISDSLLAIQAALTAFTEAGFEHELIVCDNNSTDRTGELARAAGARVVFEPVNQIARARNSGAAAATGDWLVFVDADSFPSRELFSEAARAIRNPRTLAGGAPVKMDQFDWRAWFFTKLWNGVSRLFGWAAGSFIFCETATFRELKGFNQDLFASEEIDLFHRINPAARAKQRRVVILRTPLLTSARKLSIYSRWELFRFVLRAAFRPFATVKDRAACSIWYDGRR